MSVNFHGNTTEYTTWTKGNIKKELTNVTIGINESDFIPKNNNDCIWLYNENRCKFLNYCSLQKENNDKTMSDSCRLKTNRRLLWTFPLWLNPFYSNNSEKNKTINSFNTSNISTFNETAVELLASTLNTTIIEPTDGCYYFCDIPKKLIYNSIDAKKLPNGIIYNTIYTGTTTSFENRRLRGLSLNGKDMIKKITCLMGSGYYSLHITYYTLHITHY